MKLKDIVNSKSVLVQLNQSRGMNGVTAYRIGKDIKMIDTELESYDQARTHILEKYSNKDEDNNPIIKDGNYDISQESLLKALDEINALLEEDIELNLKKISVEDLANVSLSPQEIMQVDYLFEGEDYD